MLKILQWCDTLSAGELLTEDEQGLHGDGVEEMGAHYACASDIGSQSVLLAAGLRQAWPPRGRRDPPALGPRQCQGPVLSETS